MGKAYEVNNDNLVLDGQRIDVKNMEITISDTETAGVIERGQVIDSTSSGYIVHETAGKSNAIVAECVEYEAGETTVVVPCYITGEFRKSEVITDVELDDTDVEALRLAGIILS